MDSPSNLRSRCAFITGVNGFTGRYVWRAFSAGGYDVYGTVHGEVSDGDRNFVVDLCDLDLLKEVIAFVRPDIVVHLAAVSFVAHGDVGELYRTNIIGTRNLLSALIETGVSPSAVLLASSANVYGNASCGAIDEAVAPAPANDYAVSKLAMEYLAKLWMGRLPISIVRPFNYTGVGQARKFLLPKIVFHYAQGCREIMLGNLDVARDFSDVRTVADIYLKLARGQVFGNVVNVCSGKAYTLSEVLALMSEIAGYKIDVKINPDFVRSDEVKVLMGARSKLESIVGPIDDIPFRDTLQWMYEAELERIGR